VCSEFHGVDHAGGRKATMIQHPVTIASTLMLLISANAASAADQSVWDQCSQTRDTDASLTACTQILKAAGETTSDRAIAYYIRGGAYRTKGDSDSAIADYTKAIEANSQYADAYVGRGIVYHSKGDSDGAIADYTKALEIDPRYAEAYVGRGTVYRIKGDNNRALTDFTKAIEIIPRYAEAYDIAAMPSRPWATTIGRLPISARRSK
jgi:tetratricopeptide (TPR) repeat protein